jgi:hypothetical protein
MTTIMPINVVIWTLPPRGRDIKHNGASADVDF